MFDESGPGGIWADNQQVISKPDFKYFIVEKTFEFVILASDGLWDVFKSSEVGNDVIAKRKLSIRTRTAAYSLCCIGELKGGELRSQTLVDPSGFGPRGSRIGAESYREGHEGQHHGGPGGLPPVRHSGCRWRGDIVRL